MSAMARLKKSKVRVSLALAGLTALILLAVAWANDSSNTRSGRSGHQAGTWTPGGRLPAPRLARATLSPRGLASVQAALAISRGIDAQSIREVVSGGALGRGLKPITARGPDGAPCVSFITESGGARQFSCLDSSGAEGVLVRFAASGGATINKTDWTTLVGLARSDVLRVTVVSRDDSERTLPLNRWNGFTYSADDPEAFPTTLRAYDAAGSLIEELATLP
jgi:hypothetical protein